MIGNKITDESLEALCEGLEVCLEIYQKLPDDGRMLLALAVSKLENHRRSFKEDASYLAKNYGPMSWDIQMFRNLYLKHATQPSVPFEAAMVLQPWFIDYVGDILGTKRRFEFLLWRKRVVALEEEAITPEIIQKCRVLAETVKSLTKRNIYELVASYDPPIEEIGIMRDAVLQTDTSPDIEMYGKQVTQYYSMKGKGDSL